jgi:SAM-dependent methyltransferase
MEKRVSDLGVDGGWTDSAEAWIALAPEHDTRKLLLDPVMLDEAGPVAGKRVLDLGCGEGRFSRLLEAKGAEAVGIDPIRRLIEAAREASAPSERYVLGDGSQLPFPDSSFDLVVAYLCLIDIPDFRAAIRESARVLRPGGRFVVANVSNLASASGEPATDSDGHFLHYAVDRYLEERPVKLEFGGLRIRNWHRPLSAYMDAYLAAGLRLLRYLEPLPNDDSLRDIPRFESRIECPRSMSWSGRRKGSSQVWFICLRRSIVEREQWTTPVDDHLAWMKQQHDAGKIIFSGPGHGEDDTAYGIYLIRCGSKQEAQQIAAGDPFTANGHCAFELIEWEVHQILGAGGFTMAGLQATLH